MNFFVEKLSSFALKSTSMTIFTIGIGIIIGAVSISLILVPTKLLAVIVAAFGTFVGSTITASSMTKIISRQLEEEQKGREQEIKARLEIEERLSNSEKIEMERDSLQDEITSLRNMKLDINSIKPIMDLGVAKAKMTFRDWHKQTISKESSWISGEEIKEYIGLLECTYTATLGVDLLKLRFFENEHGQIEISGLKTETIGIKNRTHNWLIKEIRTKQKKSKFWDTNAIEKEDSELIEYSDQQSNRIDKTIENGINLKHFDEYIVQLARDFVILLLKPLNKKIIFIEDDNGGEELIHFLNKHNEVINDKIDELRYNKRVTYENNL